MYTGGGANGHFTPGKDKDMFFTFDSASSFDEGVDFNCNRNLQNKKGLQKIRHVNSN